MYHLLFLQSCRRNRLVSPTVSTGPMCYVEVRAKKAVIPPHLPRCLVSSPTEWMFRVVADQLRGMTLRGAKELPKIYNVAADSLDV